MQWKKSATAAYQEKVREEDFAGALVDRISDDGWAARIDELPYKLRQVVLLRYLNDFSQEEVAEILGIPLGTVKSRIHSALERLRKIESAANQNANAKGDLYEIGTRNSHSSS